MAGLNPRTADEVNNQVGSILRQFTDIKESVGHFHDGLAPLDLTKDPYNMTEEEQVLIKSAITDLDVALDAINMVFINRLTGLW